MTPELIFMFEMMLKRQLRVPITLDESAKIIEISKRRLGAEQAVAQAETWHKLVSEYKAVSDEMASLASRRQGDLAAIEKRFEVLYLLDQTLGCEATLKIELLEFAFKIIRKKLL